MFIARISEQLENFDLGKASRLLIDYNKVKDMGYKFSDKELMLIKQFKAKCVEFVFPPRKRSVDAGGW